MYLDHNRSRKLLFNMVCLICKLIFSRLSWFSEWFFSDNVDEVVVSVLIERGNFGENDWCRYVSDSERRMLEILWASEFGDGLF